MQTIETEQKYKSFKVVVVSSNTNSFGLKNMVILAQDGEAWSVCANSLYIRKQGEILQIPTNDGVTQIISMKYPFELPKELPRAPKAVIKEVWGK